MEGWVEVLQSVGFPILCVLALGYFVYSSYQKMITDTKEREDKLYAMLTSAQATISSAVENNVKLAAQIEIMQKNVEKLAEDIEDIKDSVKKEV